MHSQDSNDAKQSPAVPQPKLPLLHRGKVRDVYDAGDGHLLLVASDRLSAFDVILPNPVPGKGEVLTQLSNFWFAHTRHWVPNHLTGIPVGAVVNDAEVAQALRWRAVVVRRLQRLPLEAVVRGYLIGSGWKDYQRTGQVCGVQLPANLHLAERLSEPLFTPSTKAAAGDHDENISFSQLAANIGDELAQRLRSLSIHLYEQAAALALRQGIIIADTKFEFGLDEQGDIVLIDEVLTPDSSRFWPLESYQVGHSPPSFDKQYIRDYLERLNWNKQAPGPHLPEHVIKASFERYRQAYEQLTQSPWPPQS